MATVKFIKDFANKTKGEVWSCDSMLACSLRKRGIAELAKEESDKPKRARRTKAQIEAEKAKDKKSE